MYSQTLLYLLRNRLKVTDILTGDVRDKLRELPSESVHCVVCSPPYWGLRDYGTPGQLGLEPTPQEHVAVMVEVFREVRRVLRKDGTLWLNEGDCYASAAACKRPNRLTAALKEKDLVGMPWMIAFALRDDGWWLRSDIIWHKPNPMPESVSDRPTKAHEYLFLLSKAANYYYDADAIREGASQSSLDRGRYDRGDMVVRKGGDLMAKPDYLSQTRGNWPSERNKRTVWTIATEPYPEAHFATFPTDLVRPCILAGTSEKGCCSECGKSWNRVTDKEVLTVGKGKNHIAPGNDHGWEGTPRASLQVQTTGWKAGCSCNAALQPCTVLDPFMGSGTTGEVALQYGRNFIGIELNESYVEMARKRIAPYEAQEILSLY